MQLNKYIASCGITSRRKAVELIKQGFIRVNNTVVTDPSTLIVPQDKVTYQGSVLKPEKKVYIVLNKPKGFITTRTDPEGRQTIFDLLPKSIHARLSAVGRLDTTTTGLLLLTNDGDLTQQLAHPRYEVKKTYHATLDQPLDTHHAQALRSGIALKDGRIKADELGYLPHSYNKKIAVTIHSGKNHIVRRMFRHFGYNVIKLDRVALGPLTKKGLAQGHWRYLTKKEISMLAKNERSFDTFSLRENTPSLRQGLRRARQDARKPFIPRERAARVEGNERKKQKR